MNVDKNLSIPKSESWKMFDEISPRYDFLNHLLSFGLDSSWRRSLVNYLPEKEKIRMLDLATGTGDVIVRLLRASTKIDSAVGIDMADKMLELAGRKIREEGLHHRAIVRHGDANHIQYPDGNFDLVTMAFGIRNVTDPKDVLKEMNRILRPGGRALILEFSLPQNQWLRRSHLFYLQNLVPLLGGLISGHFKAYRYLNQTIETFPYGQAFCDLMRAQGFQNVKPHLLMGGIATIYQGDK